ncbi:MAG: GNAT family N-acetyltransferase [Chloroflexota bacterium]
MADRSGVVIRRATEADLLECHRVWRDAIIAYTSPLGETPLPEDNPGVRRLHAHMLGTDPGRFLVAEQTNQAGESHIMAFGAAVDRGPLWFLSMLFVEPGEQARGLGRALLERMLPLPMEGRILATCTDSAQPISNGLYSTLGIVPRLPMFMLVGRPRPGFEWPVLPDGIAAERVAGPEAARWREGAELSAFDTAIAGFSHPEDHRFIQDEPRHLFTFRGGDGALLGYGYAGDIGRLGPIAVADRALLTPVLGHLLRAIEPRGASAVWLPGASDDSIATAIRAGMRIEGFPILTGWTRPFADFTRYVPISPGLM